MDSALWAIFGKQNWRCGMNQSLSESVKMCANLETRKGVGSFRQQDSGHGSRYLLRSV